MNVAADLAIVWAFIIAFAVFVYVVMDGFDLGLGILFPLFPEKRDRDVIMNSVAPVWDGNETWLVLGGGGLMAAFPLADAVLMPALYTPMIVMLLGLVFREPVDRCVKILQEFPGQTIIASLLTVLLTPVLFKMFGRPALDALAREDAGHAGLKEAY